MSSCLLLPTPTPAQRSTQPQHTLAGGVCAVGARGLIFFSLTSRLIHLLGGVRSLCCLPPQKKTKNRGYSASIKEERSLKIKKTEAIQPQKKQKTEAIKPLSRRSGLFVLSLRPHPPQRCTQRLSAPLLPVTFFFSERSSRRCFFFCFFFVRTCVFLSSLL